MSIEFILNQMIKSLTEAKVEKPWKFPFRPSSMPFCQRSFLFYYLTEPEMRPTDSESYRMDMYCDIGTAVHYVMQKWLARQGKLYGNWGCPRCDAYWVGWKGVWGVKATTKDVVGPVRCCCGIEKEYVEYGFVESRTGMRAHSDGFLPMNLAEMEFCLLEFKTSGLRVIGKLKSPNPSHVIQAQIYASLAEARGMHIKKIAIIYICRDIPQKVKVFTLEPDPSILEGVVEHRKEVDKLLEAAGSEEFGIDNWPEPICQNMKDGEKVYCPYRYNCFATNPKKIVVDLINDYKERKRGKKIS